MVDIRDPELIKVTGISCAHGNVTLDIPCPSGRNNTLPAKSVWDIMLVVYVDDFEMSGPLKFLPKAWKA